MPPNKSLIYKQIPTGLPVPGQDLVIEDRPIDLELVPERGLVAEILYASFDPYLRGRMRDPSIKSYNTAFRTNYPVINDAIGKILKSNDPDFAEGDIVTGLFPIGEYAAITDAKKYSIRKIHNPHNLDLALFVGALGMPGLTAWAGLHKIGQPKPGETIFVSSAAGAVGQLVGQIAKREGLTVIGSVGSDEKLAYITNELGFNAGFNYKKESPRVALARLAPEGIDIYFENVGGEHLEAALQAMKVGGRIPVCGMIDTYNTPIEQQKGIKGLMTMVGKGITMQGFLVGMPDFGPVYYKEQQEKMQQWIADGSIKTKLYVTEGMDNAAEGFVGMLQGKNFGKAVLKVK